MKVRELHKQLSKLDPELEVVCYCEDEGLLVKGRGFMLFDIFAVSAAPAERLCLGDGAPYLKFERSSAPTTIATLEITSDF